MCEVTFEDLLTVRNVLYLYTNGAKYTKVLSLFAVVISFAMILFFINNLN